MNATTVRGFNPRATKRGRKMRRSGSQPARAKGQSDPTLLSSASLPPNDATPGDPNRRRTPGRIFARPYPTRTWRLKPPAHAPRPTHRDPEPTDSLPPQKPEPERCERPRSEHLFNSKTDFNPFLYQFLFFLLFLVQFLWPIRSYWFKESILIKIFYWF